MLRVRKYVRVAAVAITAVCIGALPSYVAASTPANVRVISRPDVFITEVQTNGGIAAQEFIELYNSTDQTIDFGAANASWRLQFFASSSVKTGSPAWTTAPTDSNSVQLTGAVPPHDYYLISSSGYLPGGTSADQYYSATSSHLMTDTGGGLQLLSGPDNEGWLTAHDRFMWLDQKANPVLPAGVVDGPDSGMSLQRLPDADMEYIGADGVLTGFGTSSEVSPLDAWREPVVVTPAEESPADHSVTNPDDAETTPSTTPTDDSSGTVAEGASIPPAITEILPNPGSPLTDAADEFIEVYNPNDSAISLAGYSLQVGTTTLHTYVVPGTVVIPAHGYQAFYSSDTRLSLTNSGGQARLLSPDDVVISETAAYTTAAVNQSWILSGDSWLWTTLLTPGRANVVSLPPATTGSVGAAAATTPRVTKTAAAKVVAPKAPKVTNASKAKTAVRKTTVKKAKAASVKKKKSKAAAAKTAAIGSAASVKAKPPIHRGILVAIAIAALLYALYEYRHDISDKFRQLREHRAARSRAGLQTSWRRGYSPHE